MNLNSRALVAEAVGTFAWVSAVCGAALFSAPSAGLVAVAFAVGISVLAMTYAVGHISGGPFQSCGHLGTDRGRTFRLRAEPFPTSSPNASAASPRPSSST